MNILIIPHQPYRTLRVRSLEMARVLAKNPANRVHVLTWVHYAPPVSSPLLKPVLKLAEALTTATTAYLCEEEDGINWLKMPYLLAPSRWCQRFNERQIEYLLEKHAIDTVINANAYHFPLPAKRMRPLRYIYDVVDDHISPQSGPHWQKTRVFTLGELAKADCALTVSHALAGLLAENKHPGARCIPNGVDVEAFQAVLPESVAALRQQLGLQDRFVIGLIGNHGWWSGMDFMLEVFACLRKTCPSAALLVVGPAGDLSKRARDNPGVVMTGPVPPDEVAAYFHASDVGVLPFTLCPFTHNALPIKVLEFGAAQKPVLSTPLAELETLALPYVTLRNPDLSDWVDVLSMWAARRPEWKPAWDAVIDGYDWHRVMAPVSALLSAEGRDVIVANR